MVNWEAVSALGTIIGSIAVLVTLMYLAVQIRQNEVNVISIVLSAPRARDWWKNAGRKSFGNQFVEFVDEVIHDQPASVEFYRSLGSWAKR